MAVILAYRNRGITKDVTVLDADENAITVDASDTLRAVIGRRGQPDKLTVLSSATTTNGSSFTKNSPTATENRLRLDAQDLNFTPGIYTLFISLLDDDDAQDWKEVSRDVFVLEEEPTL